MSAVIAKFGIRAATLAAAAAAVLVAARPAVAEPPYPVVVELYTSQGCSSCPPADAFLGELAQLDGVIALSLHVDYWDYLGWRDVFGSHENTIRQVGYRDRAGVRSVYTPQMVINGADLLVGSHRNNVLASMRAHATRPHAAEIALAVKDGMLEARISPQRATAEPCTVWVVGYRTPEPVMIERGENTGKTIQYVNVTTGFMRLGAWKGEAAKVTSPIPPEATGMVVILQEGDHGPIVASAKIDF